MNKVMLIGNLTKDPEIRSTAGGKKVASFSLAVNEGKDANGQEQVQYFNASAWDRLAEILEQYIKKGTKVAIVGKLKNRSWDKPDGTKGYATDITCTEIEILTSRQEAERLAQTHQEDGSSNKGEYSKPAASSTPAESVNDLPEIDVDSINVQMPF